MSEKARTRPQLLFRSLGRGQEVLQHPDLWAALRPSRQKNASPIGMNAEAEEGSVLHPES